MRPSLCVYAGVPSAMFLANRDPEADLAIMRIARENMRRIAPEKIVLVSTIAVYADSRGKDESSPMAEGGLSPMARTACSWRSGFARTSTMR